MRILVTGGTGTVGSHVVRELLVRNAEVSVLTRDASKVKGVNASVKLVEGDLGDPGTVRRIFRGFDAVFLLIAVSPTEATEGMMAINGMRLAGPDRIVYMSVHQADRLAWLPHFGSKVGIEEALKASGIDYSVLRPNNFFQNDYWYKQALLQQGVYPQPLGSAGVSRVDVRDIAEAAAITLTEDGHSGATYDLVGPDELTGPRTAEIWSRALGLSITYGGDDLDAWENQSLRYLPASMAFDFRCMYEAFQRQGLKGSTEAIARETKLIGHPPRSFESFARETAVAWTADTEVHPEARPS
jgi:uncharacterized protein YbjT (DUF2867 family)